LPLGPIAPLRRASRGSIPGSTDSGACRATDRRPLRADLRNVARCRNPTWYRLTRRHPLSPCHPAPTFRSAPLSGGKSGSCAQLTRGSCLCHGGVALCARPTSRRFR
jgi:hypothetical protein